MKSKKSIIPAILISFLAIAALKPMVFPNIPKKHVGKIISISKGGVNDAVLNLENNSTSFYLNRGFEKFKVEHLNSLIGKTAIIEYSEGANLLDPFNKSSKNIESLTIDKQLFFTE